MARHTGKTMWLDDTSTPGIICLCWTTAESTRHITSTDFTINVQQITIVYPTSRMGTTRSSFIPIKSTCNRHRYCIQDKLSQRDNGPNCKHTIPLNKLYYTNVAINTNTIHIYSMFTTRTSTWNTYIYYNMYK
jgi:hypothetical protein